MSTPTKAPSERARIRHGHKRASYDRETTNAILECMPGSLAVHPAIADPRNQPDSHQPDPIDTFTIGQNS